jgi:cell division transport system ATP-binding protein
MLECRGLAKVYRRASGGRVEALAGVSFEVKAGELVVLVGPTAAGKTVLQRLITGDERPTRGAVLVEGVEVGALGPGRLARLRRTLGVVPQPALLVADRTALDNVRFLLRALGARAGEAEARAREALAEAGLVPVRHARPAELTEGERRRLLLARALATEPRLLIADEPAGGLEGGARAAVVDLLRAAHHRGTTCLVLTQAAELAAALPARHLRLVAGRLEGEAAPA